MDRGIIEYVRADYDNDTEEWTATGFDYGYEPTRLAIYYRAGIKNEHSELYPMTRMDPMWERAIIMYALASLRTEVNGCDNVSAQVEHYQVDLARSADHASFSLSADDLSNPLGTTRAGVDLWQLIKRARLAYAR